MKTAIATTVTARSFAALDAKRRQMIKAHPDTLVMNLFHADPSVKALAEELNVITSIDYDAADALKTTTDLDAIAEELAAPTSWDHLAGIAANPLTNANQLTDLVILSYGAEVFTMVTYYALRHRHLPAFLLDWATSDWAGADTAKYAAASPNLNIEQQQALARNSVLAVQEALAHNPVTHPMIRDLVITKIRLRRPNFAVAA